MVSSSPSSPTNYAKLSLYLGVVSVIGAGCYAYWQITNSQSEKRLRTKYVEAKNAIKHLQEDFGLLPTGELDSATRQLLLNLGAQQGHAL